MPARDITCYLFEPDGTLLTVGTARLRAALGAGEALVTALDQPGRLVQRCLLGNLQHVWVQLKDGALLPARVERVFFDPAAGRSCALHIAAA